MAKSHLTTVPVQAGSAICNDGSRLVLGKSLSGLGKAGMPSSQEVIWTQVVTKVVLKYFI